MDNRLIPPSHFDPNEKVDSLDLATSSDASSLRPAVRTPGFRVTSSLLRPPEDFSPNNAATSKKGFGFANLARSQVHPPSPDFGSGRYDGTSPSQRDHPISVMLPVQKNLHCSPDKHSDLVKLRAENEAMKSLLEGKRRESENKMLQQPLRKEQIPAHQAVIEHQTQHIARLQKDLDEGKFLLAKRNNEIAQCESTLAAKEMEIRRLHETITVSQSQLDEKDEAVRNKELEIVELLAQIQELKSDIEQIKDDHSMHVRDLQKNFAGDNETLQANLLKQIDELETNHNKEISRFHQQIASLENGHTQKVTELMRSHAEEKADLMNMIDETKKSHLANVDELRKNLAELKRHCGDVTEALSQEKAGQERLQSELDGVRNELAISRQDSEKHVAKVKQLQAYIGELQSQDYERSKWKTEKMRCEESIQVLQSEKESLNKTLELQDVRLQSITKILTTQEEAINANTKAFSADNVKGNLASVVVRRWREKVLELMIRNKSDEITMKNMENNYRSAESDVREQLEDEKRINIILENQLTESKALLEMKQREIAQLEAKDKSKSEELENIGKKAADLENLLATVSDEVRKSTGGLCQLYQEKMTKMTEKLIHLEQRLVFATNRMKTLRDLYVRRENLLKAKLKAVTDNALLAQKVDVVPEKEVATQIDRPDLIAEIQRLTEERDSLSRKLSDDSSLFKSATAHFKSEEAKLLDSVSMLQNEVHNKNEELAELKISVMNLEEKLNDKGQMAAEAVDNLRNFQENQEKVIEQKLDEAWRKWYEEKKELLYKLEECQREHARTVVTARQSERNAVREKKRAAENLEAVTAEHKVEMESLKAKINSVKLDNNLLMTTLRQHGLTSTFKSTRKDARLKEGISNRPKTSPSPKKVKAQHIRTGSSTPGCSGRSPRSKSVVMSQISSAGAPIEPSAVVGAETNMEDLLKDLVVMTENILNDSN